MASLPTSGTAPLGHAQEQRSSRGAGLRPFGLTLSGLGLLAAVATLVVLVSLPRLRALTVRTGELDARSTLRLLADTLEMPEPGTSIGAALASERSELERALQDARLVENGRVLLHHGYCFELLTDDVGPVFLAWPERAGRTGIAAFALRPEGLLGHPNPEGPGRWSGTRPPTSDLDPSLWRGVRRR